MVSFQRDFVCVHQISWSRLWLNSSKWVLGSIDKPQFGQPYLWGKPWPAHHSEAISRGLHLGAGEGLSETGLRGRAGCSVLSRKPIGGAQYYLNLHGGSLWDRAEAETQQTTGRATQGAETQGWNPGWSRANVKQGILNSTLSGDKNSLSLSPDLPKRNRTSLLGLLPPELDTGWVIPKLQTYKARNVLSQTYSED